MSMGSGITLRPDHGDPSVVVTDHEYWGNMCSGFGGTLECEHVDFSTRYRCGLPPYQHRYHEPTHRGEAEARESLEPTEAPRHRQD